MQWNGIQWHRIHIYTPYRYWLWFCELCAMYVIYSEYTNSTVEANIIFCQKVCHIIAMDVIYQNEGRVQWRMNDDPVSEAVPTICHAKMKTVTYYSYYSYYPYYLMPMHSLHSTDLYNNCLYRILAAHQCIHTKHSNCEKIYLSFVSIIDKNKTNLIGKYAKSKEKIFCHKITYK